LFPFGFISLTESLQCANNVCIVYFVTNIVQSFLYSVMDIFRNRMLCFSLTENCCFWRLW